MYIWLNDGAEEEIEALKEEGRLGDVRVDTAHSSGKKYLSVYGNIFSPTVGVLDVPEELIERVTFQDRIYRGLRTEGVYHHEDATLLVKTEVRVHSEMMADRIEREEWQDISVSAPNMEKLRAIYTLVRQGKLSPDENWGDDAPPTPPSDAQEGESETAID